MPAYHYIALSKDQKELSGVIEAPDEVGARKKLNDLSLSVVSLESIAAVSHADQKNIFEFEATDKNNKKVVGTIASDDPVKAYSRLFEEYQLNVISIVSSKLSPEDKVTAKKLGVANLHEEYERLYKKKAMSEDDAASTTAAQQAERDELLGRVDFTMKRVEDFLSKYGTELKIDERDAIRAYLNQLMRIKSSTNLEHIRSTCERMLDHIQKKELFINEDQRTRESAQVKIETKELLSELRHTGLKQDIDVIKTFAKLEKIPILKPAARFILRLFSVSDPEIRRLRNDIKAINGHIRSYLKLLVLGRSSVFRSEAWESIKTLREEKYRLKLQIASLKMEKNKSALAESEPGLFWENAATLCGWILAFYLLSYLVAYPFTIKQFGILSAPKVFYFYYSTFAKGITLLLFIAYGAITVRNFWLKKNWGAILILYPLSLFGFLLIVINLM